MTDANRLDPNKSLRELRDEQRYTERELDDESLERHREHVRNLRRYPRIGVPPESETPHDERKPSEWVDPYQGYGNDYTDP